MATKEEKAEQINEILGTNIEWDRLLQDDLNLFLELLEEGALIEPQMKHIVKEKGSEKLEDQVDEWYPGKLIGGLV